MSVRKVQNGCRTSRGRKPNTLLATRNRAMVRATRFLMKNSSSSRITWHTQKHGSVWQRLTLMFCASLGTFHWPGSSSAVLQHDLWDGKSFPRAQHFCWFRKSRNDDLMAYWLVIFLFRALVHDDVIKNQKAFRVQEISIWEKQEFYILSVWSG